MLMVSVIASTLSRPAASDTAEELTQIELWREVIASGERSCSRLQTSGIVGDYFIAFRSSVEVNESNLHIKEICGKGNRPHIIWEDENEFNRIFTET